MVDERVLWPQIKTQQNVINRAAWKLAANNLVALNDTINTISYLQQIATTGLAAKYDNAYVVRRW